MRNQKMMYSEDRFDTSQQKAIFLWFLNRNWVYYVESDCSSSTINYVTSLVLPKKKLVSRCGPFSSAPKNLLGGTGPNKSNPYHSYYRWPNLLSYALIRSTVAHKRVAIKRISILLLMGVNVVLTLFLLYVQYCSRKCNGWMKSRSQIRCVKWEIMRSFNGMIVRSVV